MTRHVDGKNQADWQVRMARFRASGLSAAQFCRNEHLSQASFYYWAKRLPKLDRSDTGDGLPPRRRSEHSGREQGVEFVEIIVGDSIRLRVPANGPANVAALIKQLVNDLPTITAPATSGRFQLIDQAGSTTPL